MPMVGGSYSNLNEYTDNNDSDNSEGEKENEDENNFNILNLHDNSEVADNNSESDDLEGGNEDESNLNINQIQNNGGGRCNNFVTKTGTSYIPLPSSIQNKRGTINPQNSDQLSFKWSILAKHVIGRNKSRIGNNYYQHEKKYNFTGLSFPCQLSDVKIFEHNNITTSINVYGLEKKFNAILKTDLYIVFPLKVIDEEKTDHFDLLFIMENEKVHFIFINNFSRLIRAQSTGHNEKRVFCKRCFTSFDERVLKYRKNGQAGLEEHMKICGTHKPILPVLPTPGSTLDFKSWGNSLRHPIVIYADFEALLVKMDVKRGEKTMVIQKHEAMSYGFVVKASEDVPPELLEKYNIPTSPVIYRGSEVSQDVGRYFVEAIVDVGRRIEDLLKTRVPMIISEEEEKTHQECKVCYLCKRSIIGREKVRDHCHLSGKFRQTLCSKCNLALILPKFVPCYFHNLSNYDSNFIISNLAYDTKTITVIPNSEEKFISFSKYLSSTFTIRFIDTIRFMSSSLERLAENLITPGFEKFRETAKHFVTGDMALVSRKGVYPYDYTDSWEKLDENRLPRKEEFYSTLKEIGVEDREYEHAEEVWRHFGCTTLGEYSDFYLKIDVLLLCDVFENFRDVCMKAYSIDPAFYYTAPGMSFDCMLKKTDIKLDLLTDYEMVLMIEKGIKKFLSCKD